MTTQPETKNAVFDIAELDTAAACEEGAILEVRHPATNEVLRHEDGRPFTIKLAGKDSDRVQKAARDQTDRNIAAQSRTKAPTKVAVIEKGNIDVLVAATLEWDVVLGGGKATNNATAYREAYTKFKWLAEQVDEFVGARANFLKS